MDLRVREGIIDIKMEMYRDNGKDNGKKKQYDSVYRECRGYIRIMVKKMEKLL